MPEMQFHIRWPDGTAEACYSPSLVVKEYFEAGRSYPLETFVDLSRTTLRIASDRVQAKYGMPCSRALAQLSRIEAAAGRLAKISDARVTIERFEEL